ncbi:hypothetical protein [Streptomyces violaceusniger]|uniref:hypothetical protein n=1 Tax=Streptomyces violaceusniger TaxID=68280 RepID=UPI00369522B9
MDLAGIGALASAVVAGLGIPSAIVVGRWQTKAAVRAAQATSEAGQAQANATYRAALDSVRDQARTEHQRWRQSLRRDAWMTFLVAAETARATALRQAAEPSEPHTETAADAMRELGAAFTLVELEGPSDMADLARGVHNEVVQHSACCDAQARYRQVEAILSHVADLGNNNGTVYTRSLREVRENIAALRNSRRPLVHRQRAISEARPAAEQWAQSLRNTGLLTETQAELLASDPTGERLAEAEAEQQIAQERLASARTAFVEAARVHLEHDGQLPAAPA